jgi:hypothetical protein
MSGAKQGVNWRRTFEVGAVQWNYVFCWLDWGVILDERTSQGLSVWRIRILVFSKAR